MSLKRVPFGSIPKDRTGMVRCKTRTRLPRVRGGPPKRADLAFRGQTGLRAAVDLSLLDPFMQPRAPRSRSLTQSTKRLPIANSARSRDPEPPAQHGPACLLQIFRRFVCSRSIPLRSWGPRKTGRSSRALSRSCEPGPVRLCTRARTPAGLTALCRSGVPMRGAQSRL